MPSLQLWKQKPSNRFWPSLRLYSCSLPLSEMEYRQTAANSTRQTMTLQLPWFVTGCKVSPVSFLLLLLITGHVLYFFSEDELLVFWIRVVFLEFPVTAGFQDTAVKCLGDFVFGFSCELRLFKVDDWVWLWNVLSFIILCREIFLAVWVSFITDPSLSFTILKAYNQVLNVNIFFLLI